MVAIYRSTLWPLVPSRFVSVNQWISKRGSSNGENLMRRLWICSTFGPRSPHLSRCLVQTLDNGFDGIARNAVQEGEGRNRGRFGMEDGGMDGGGGGDDRKSFSYFGYRFAPGCLYGWSRVSVFHAGNFAVECRRRGAVSAATHESPQTAFFPFPPSRSSF